MSYRAQAFHTSLPDGRADGRIVIDANGLHFTSADGASTCLFPMSALEMKLTGMNSTVPEFRHASQAGWVIICNDPSVLDDTILRSSDAFRGKLKKAASTRSWAGFVKSCIILTSPLILLLGVLWWFRDDISAAIVRQIPIKVEKDIGDALWVQVEATEKIIQNEAYAAQIEAVTKQLVPHANAPEGMEFKFHIAEDDKMTNAFAMPGGNVVVYTGLLKKVKRPDQLAGVLAHEIAHVTERHSLNNMVTSLGLSSALSALIGDASTITAIISGGSEMLLGQKFSRDAEREADAVAWETMVRAKFDPAGLREFFEILKEEERKAMGNLMSGPLQWISTHPDTDERIQRLREKEVALKSPK